MPNPFFKTRWLHDIADIDAQKHNNLLMINSTLSIHRAVRKSVGISVLPDFIINNDDTLETLFENMEPPAADMYFVYAQDRRNSQRIEAFKSFLIQNIKTANLHKQTIWTDSNATQTPKKQQNKAPKTFFIHPQPNGMQKMHIWYFELKVAFLHQITI